jgi:DNA-binding MarR family transcriptional regulator
MTARTAAIEPRVRVPVLPCACANWRRAARSISRIYNHELRSHGIEITQLTILMTLDQTGEISQGKLGKFLGLDSTTLTRTLELVSKRGWIRLKEGKDRRVRIIAMTPAGSAKLQQTLPAWKRAQDRVRKRLGDEAVAQLGTLSARVTEMSIEG